MKDTEIILKFAEDLLSGSHLPVRRMTLPCPDAARFDQGLRQDILHLSGLEDTVNQFLQELKLQKLYFIRDDYLCTYMFLRIPDSDEIFSCGPVVYEQVQGDRLKQLLKELDIPEKLSDLFRDYYLNVSYVAAPLQLANLFTLLARRLFGEDGYEIVETTFQDLGKWSDFYQNYFRIEETPFLSIQMIESRYQTEGDLITAVQKGNEKKALDLLTRQASHIIPERLTSHLRDQMDYCITLNTLLRKAAEMAGVHPIHIDSLSNQNVKTIETLSSLEQCAAFQRECIQNYCRLVRRYTLGNYSSLTQKVLTYISTDLSADLSLKNFPTCSLSTRATSRPCSKRRSAYRSLSMLTAAASGTHRHCFWGQTFRSRRSRSSAGSRIFTISAVCLSGSPARRRKHSGNPKTQQSTRPRSAALRIRIPVQSDRGSTLPPYPPARGAGIKAAKIPFATPVYHKKRMPEKTSSFTYRFSLLQCKSASRHSALNDAAVFTYRAGKPVSPGLLCPVCSARAFTVFPGSHSPAR